MSRGPILATVTSKTNPGRSYDIIMGKDGVMYCSCPAWRFRKDCKHLQEFMHAVYDNAQAIKNKPLPINDPESDLHVALKEAIALLSQG